MLHQVVENIVTRSVNHQSMTEVHHAMETCIQSLASWKEWVDDYQSLTTWKSYNYVRRTMAAPSTNFSRHRSWEVASKAYLINSDSLAISRRRLRGSDLRRLTLTRTLSRMLTISKMRVSKSPVSPTLIRSLEIKSCKAIFTITVGIILTRAVIVHPSHSISIGVRAPVCPSCTQASYPRSTRLACAPPSSNLTRLKRIVGL